MTADKNAITKKPLVSVIMPVFNAEKYLSESIDSILAQTFTNFELLALDDGSTDGSLKILQQYAQHDTRIRVISRENRGISESLNDMINLAQGLWIARMDADDIALPNRLERQLEWLAQTDADITGSWFQRFGTIDRRIICQSESNDVLHKDLLFDCIFAHPTVMMRDTVAALHYDKSFGAAQDLDLWVRAAAKGFRMTNVPEILLLHRNHPGQISSRLRDRQVQLTLEIRQRYWKLMAKSLELEESAIDDIITMFATHPKKIKTDSVAEAFAKVLSHSPPSGRAVILNRITTLYFKNVANNPEIIKQWKKLNSKFGTSSGFWTIFYLQIFRFFRIHPNGKKFNLVRRCYLTIHLCKTLIQQKAKYVYNNLSKQKNCTYCSQSRCGRS